MIEYIKTIANKQSMLFIYNPQKLSEKLRLPIWEIEHRFNILIDNNIVQTHSMKGFRNVYKILA